ncbi:MAG TPA: hypothetical protein VKK06_13465, partial [Terriglobia bacterium]|nr:hypothetical protein [Terriglobia bacterium]
VALLHLLWKFRIQRFENVLCHLGETFPDNVSRSDLICGNVVTEFPAVPFEYHGRDFTSPVNWNDGDGFLSSAVVSAALPDVHAAL